MRGSQRMKFWLPVLVKISEKATLAIFLFRKLGWSSVAT